MPQNSQENGCARVSFLVKLQTSTCNIINKKTLAQVFSCEFSEIFWSTFFTEHLRATALLQYIQTIQISIATTDVF